MMQISAVFFTAYLAFVTCGDLPDYFPRCYRNDDRLENCLIDASEKLKPFLKIGFPEFTIPSIDPLVLDLTDVIQHGADFEYAVRLFNLTFGGLTNYTFEELRFDTNSSTLYGRVYCPEISIDTPKAHANGKIVVVPLNGDIALSAVMGPTITNFIVRGKLETRGDEEYFVPTKIKTSISIADIYFSKFDLLNDYSRMGEFIRIMFNSNSKLIMEKSGGVFQDMSDAVVMKLLKKLTNAVPYNKILPVR